MLDWRQSYMISNGTRITITKSDSFGIFFFCLTDFKRCFDDLPLCISSLHIFVLQPVCYETKLQWSLQSCHEWRAKTLPIHDHQRWGSGLQNSLCSTPPSLNGGHLINWHCQEPRPHLRFDQQFKSVPAWTKTTSHTALNSEMLDFA